ncbi:hypothetical protein DOTSEDRAFT_27049 [Dothistroma septosporum NZE10]|uniref:Uncharacterized protein n=1 Tax=Dothistroma septosporum (strain NZE10 / CBS 128990) TaxID=675120 RepID=N1PK51_DOTSN|nr:hypothetical protein DOTSEDRAFT_27049 [Dothistroma septosporum NZE10]
MTTADKGYDFPSEPLQTASGMNNTTPALHRRLSGDRAAAWATERKSLGALNALKVSDFDTRDNYNPFGDTLAGEDCAEWLEVHGDVPETAARYGLSKNVPALMGE